MLLECKSLLKLAIVQVCVTYLDLKNSIKLNKLGIVYPNYSIVKFLEKVQDFLLPICLNLCF